LPEGGFLVADLRTGAVHHYSRDGDHLGALGGRGEGPGEFKSGPNQILLGGDSLLYVRDTELQVLHYPSGTFAWKRPLPGFWFPLALREQRLYFNYANRERKTTVASVAGPGDTLTYGGPFPELMGRSSIVDSYFAFAQLASLRGDTVAVTVTNSDYLFFGPFGGPFDSILMPVTQRRGSRPDLLEKITEDPRTAEPALYQPSAPTELAVIRPGVVAAVAADQEFVSQRLIGDLFLSIVDVRHHASCADIRIPGPQDPQPIVAFAGDTLMVLSQDVVQLGVQTWIRRYVIDTEPCGWS